MVDLVIIVCQDNGQFSMLYNILFILDATGNDVLRSTTLRFFKTPFYG